MRRCQVGIKSDRILGFGNRQLILAGARQGETRDQSVRPCIARVALGPRFQCPLLSFEVAGDVAVVQGFDEEALDIAGPIAQLVGLEQTRPRRGRLPYDAVTEPDLRVADRKIGIDRDGTLEERMGLYPPSGYERFPSGTVGVQRFKRRRRRFLERRRVFLDSGERFSDSRSDASRDLTESAQNIFFPRRLRLLVGENVAGCAVRRAQAENVLAAKHRDRSFQHGGAGRPDANALRDGGSQSRIRRLVHQWQRSSNVLVGDETEERRLLKLYRKSLSQRVVEHRIAGRVGELREHDRVLVGQLCGAAAVDRTRD